MVLTPFGKKVIKSGTWVFITNILQQAFFLIRLIILARLLAPSDFGLFGIALVTLAALDTFSRVGLREALIQKKENTKPFLDTAWTVGVIRGFLIFAVIFVAAPYVASFFGVKQAEPVLRVIGLAAILSSLGNVTVLYFEKDLKFHKNAVYLLSGAFADMVVSIVIGILTRSVWALVCGRVAKELVRCGVSYGLDSYRPRFKLDIEKAKSLFGFGRWIMASSVLIFILNQGDDIFVGRLLGVAALGFYQMAYRLSNMPTTQITHVISLVTFPAYSKVQDNIPRLREAYLMTLRVTAFLAFPIAGLVLIMAGDVTRIFLGEKWMPMVPAMQILCIFGVTRAINGTAGAIFHGVGKPGIQTKVSAVQLVIMLAIIYPLSVNWGIVGTALAVVIPNILVCGIIFRKVRKIIDSRYRDIVWRIAVPLIAVLITGVTAFFIRKTFAVTIDIWGLLAAVILLGATYLIVVSIGYGRSLRGMIKRIREIAVWASGS